MKGSRRRFWMGTVVFGIGLSLLPVQGSVRASQPENQVRSSPRSSNCGAPSSQSANLGYKIREGRCDGGTTSCCPGNGFASCGFDS